MKDIESLYLWLTPKVNTKVLHQTFNSIT